MQTTIASTLGSCPGSLAFPHDMFLNVPQVADWQAIAHISEHCVNESLHSSNRKYHQCDYAQEQDILKKVHTPTKLIVRSEGH